MSAMSDIQSSQAKPTSIKQLCFFLAIIVGYTIWFYSPVIFWSNLWTFRDLYVIQISMEYLHRLLHRISFLPLWNPYSALGKPFLADIQTASLYPPVFLSRLIPLPLGFAFNIAFHHVVSALGFYLLMGVLRVSWIAKLASSLVFSFGGYYVACDNYPNALQSVTWVPWSLYFLNPGKPDLPIRSAVLFCLSLALTILGAMPETIGITILLAVAEVFFSKSQAFEKVKKIAVIGVSSVAGLLLAAIQLLPTLEYVANSTRGDSLGASEILKFSLNPLGALAFVVPYRFYNDTGNGLLSSPFVGELPWAISLYLGTAIIVALMGWSRLPERAMWVIASAVLVSIYIALGSYIPFNSTLVESISLLRIARYPEKILLVPHLLLCVCYGYGLHHIALCDGVRWKRIWGVSSVASIVFLVVVLPYFFSIIQVSRDDVLFAVVVFTVFSVALIFSNKRYAQVLLTILVAVELAIANGTLMPTFQWKLIREAPEWYVHPSVARNELPRIYNNIREGLVASDSQYAFAQYRDLLVQTASLYSLTSNLSSGASINLCDYKLFHEVVTTIPKEQRIRFLGAFGVEFITSTISLDHLSYLKPVPKAATPWPAWVYRVDALVRPRAYLTSAVVCQDESVALESMRLRGLPHTQELAVIV